MPHGDLHKSKKKKNYLVLGLLAIFFVTVWLVTMIRIANAEVMDILPDVEISEQATTSDHAQKDDIAAAKEGKAPPMPASHTNKNTPHYDPYADPFEKGREAHLAELKGNDKKWWQKYFFANYKR